MNPAARTSTLGLPPSRAGEAPRGARPPRWPGLALSAVLAAAGAALGTLDVLRDHGFSALTLAIVLGMIAGNTVYPRLAARAGSGVDCARTALLRLGVMLYGLRLTVQDIGRVGLAGVAVDALVLGSTFALACWLGIRWLGLDRRTAMLIGAGSSICGAAAVMATEPVVKARAEHVTVAVATVVLFGTIATFLYPQLFRLDAHAALIPGGAAGFGLYAGSTIHEVAQVVAAARSVGSGAADTAVIAKMVRVMMLAPFLVLLSAWWGRSSSRHAAPGPGRPGGPARIAVPWFAFGFVGVVVAHSVHGLPAPVASIANDVDTALLATAMAALGLSTHLGAVRRAGAKPLLLGGVLFVWLVAGGALINHWVPALL